MQTKTDNPLSAEVTSTVAKLLSRENITIQRGSFPTAWFDPNARVLGLPILKHETKATTDLMVGHEVGHSLFTPVDMIEKWKVEVPGAPFDICNVLEDIRIERKIQSEYPGLIRPFRKGYEDLWKNGFFGVSHEMLDDLAFIDRLNLKAKIPELPISFSEEEERYVSLAMSVETEEDVYRVGRILHDTAEKKTDTTEKEERDESQNSDSQDQTDESEQPKTDGNNSNEDNAEGESSGLDDSEDTPEEDDTDGTEEFGNSSSSLENSEDGEEDNNSDSTGEGSEPGWDSSDLVSEVSREFEKNLQSDVRTDYEGFNFLEPPREHIYSTVNSYDEVKSARENQHSFFSTVKNTKKARIDKLYHEFQQKSKPFVASLRREFEQKKSAFQYSRATESQKGVIDVNQLHKYRHEENIFASVTQLANAKSHGMVFLLDFSASMSFQLCQTIEYVLNLSEFCRSLGIPFEVYTFTTNSHDHSMNLQSKEQFYPSGTISIESVQVNHVLSSSMKKHEYQDAARDLFIIARTTGRGTSNFTRLEGLGGTPLLESLIVLNRLILDFQKKSPHQVTNVMILTDGDGHDLNVIRNSTCSDMKYSSFLRGGYGRIAGGRYRRIDFSNYLLTYKALIENIRETCNATVLGFFLMRRDSQTLRSRLSKYTGHDYNKYFNTGGNQTKVKHLERMSKKFMKNNSLFVENLLNYNKFIFFAYDHKANQNIESSFMDTSINGATATNAALAKKFKDFNSSKKSNRIFVTEFVKTIAGNL